MTLRITELFVHERDHPLETPFRTALRTVSSVESVYVELRSDAGVRGFGEAVPTLAITGESRSSIREALSGPLRDAVVGRDGEDIVALSRRLVRAVVANRSAKAALDMALYDLVARSRGLSLTSSLGSAARSVRTDVTVGIGTTEAMADTARARVAAGFTTLKIKVGGDEDTDVARVLAVSAAVGDGAILRLDANQGWTRRQAVVVLDRLYRAGVALELVEQPVAGEDLASLAAVSRASPYPILADESVHVAADVLRIAELEAADAVNIKLMKCGGVHAAMELAAVAKAAGLGVFVGGMMESPLAVLMAASVAAVVAPDTVHDLDAAWWLSQPWPLICYEPPLLSLSPFPGVAPDIELAGLCGAAFIPGDDTAPRASD
jgi:L-alanine-DL-glutamate epimerase-like enolase superfamily enzyme